MAVVAGGALIGGLIGVDLATANGPQYTSTATALFTAVPAPGRGQLGTEAQYVEGATPTWAVIAGSGIVSTRVARALGVTALPGESFHGEAVQGTELVDVTVTGPNPAALPRQATLAAQAMIDIVVATEHPPGAATSRVGGRVVDTGSPVEDLRAEWQRWSGLLGAVLGALLAWLACALVHPGRWARRIDTTAAISPAEGADRIAEDTHAEVLALWHGLRTKRGLFVAACAVFAVFGYAFTGSPLPPLIVVLIAGWAGRKDPRWPAAALLLLGLTVLPEKVQLVRVGPITPTVSEVALVLGLLAVKPWRAGRGGRSIFTGPLFVVFAAIALGAGVGLIRHGQFAMISDTMRSMLVVIGYFVLRRAFLGRMPQLLAILLIGGALASTIEIAAAQFGWELLLVDARDSVTTGTDLSTVSRLAAPILPMWGPLVILMVSGAIRTRPRWLWCLLIVPGVVHLALSFNRSTWAPLLGCVVLVAMVRNGFRGMARRALGVVGVGVLVFVVAGAGLFGATGEALAQRVSSVVTGSALNEDSLADRLHEDTAAMVTLREEPLLGTGLGVPYGGVIVSFDNLLGSTEVDVRPWIHNQYLRVWLLMGGFGLFSFGLMFVRVTAAVTRCWSLRAPGTAVVVAGGLGLGCIAAQAVFQTSLVDRPSAMTVATCLAMVALAAEWDPALPGPVAVPRSENVKPERIMAA